MERDGAANDARIVLEFKENLDAIEKAFVDEGFSAHAVAAVGYDGGLRSFAIVARSDGELLGALTGRLFWGGLHIKHLFVRPDQRSKGVGKNLMKAAFAFGGEQQCRFAQVETMNFQALGFYLKLGFQIDFTRNGYERGCSFHYLSKQL